MIQTWQDVVHKALGDAAFGLKGTDFDQDNFVDTFMAFYDQLIWEFPYIDVPDNHRKLARQKANITYVDDMP